MTCPMKCWLKKENEKGGGGKHASIEQSPPDHCLVFFECLETIKKSKIIWDRNYWGVLFLVFKQGEYLLCSGFQIVLHQIIQITKETPTRWKSVIDICWPLSQTVTGLRKWRDVWSLCFVWSLTSVYYIFSPEAQSQNLSGYRGCQVCTVGLWSWSYIFEESKKERDWTIHWRGKDFSLVT